MYYIVVMVFWEDLFFMNEACIECLPSQNHEEASSIEKPGLVEFEDLESD